ncbi:YqhR family membrane protein, partial [Priestia megaterium]
TIGELPANTIISSLCIYILYGVFIGYSISFEAAELQTKDESTDFQTANK